MPGGLMVPRRFAEEGFADQVNAEVDRQIEESKELLGQLQAVDPHLSLVLVAENADPDDWDYPGYWYLKKRIPGSVDAYFPLAGPNGERLVPGPWVLDELRAEDLWNPAVHRDKQDAKRRMREARERAKVTEAEQRQDEMAVAYRAAMRVNGDGGMRRNASRKGSPQPKEIVLPPGVDAA